ncbi:hypothetical protein LSTR_LSTR013849 [Laodelphax striatellus]|uniref:Uncharacterized protein n=1 Tax=Laodelphax striatellus TaxID=195883 RepID=A0A482XJX9_LAOST|nr:hypothetical protein LSTR_LSTR013849 [Laodelphax striatellus]
MNGPLQSSLCVYTIRKVPAGNPDCQTIPSHFSQLTGNRDRRLSVSSETRGVARAEISRSDLGLNPGEWR